MKRRIVTAAVIAVVLAFPGVSIARTISVDFQGVSLGTVLKVLSARTDRKLITDAELSARSIVLSLDDISPDEAINALLNTYGLYYIRQPGTNIYVVKDRSDPILTKVSHVFFLNYADAEKLVPVLSPRLNVGGAMTADPRTNTIIVTDLADDIMMIGELIEILDKPTPQVLIEAKILEISINDVLQMGVQFTDLQNLNASDSPVFNQDLTPRLGGPNMRVGIIEHGFNINALVEALRVNTDARLLNNPEILVLSNETASIDIVDEVPYQELTQTEEGGMLATTNFKEVGVKIEVTPYVNSQGEIIMDIEPSHSFQTGQSVGGIPIVKASKVKTSFRLNDGETAVIGGLLRESSSTTEAKVPILGDIPLIGYFFKRTARESAQSELTIFITAKLVKHPSLR